MRNKTIRIGLAAAISTVAFGLTTAVAQGSGDQESPEEVRAALAKILGRAATLDRHPLGFDDVTDLLPNARYEYETSNGSESFTFTDLVIHGKVTSVEPGRGYYSSAEPDPVEIPFEDKRATWRTVTLNVAVLDRLAGDEEVGSTIKVGLALAHTASIDAVQAGFAAQDDGQVFFLYRDSPVFAYDKDLYSDLLDGALIAEVRGDQLRLPGFERVEPESGDLTDEQLLSKTPRLSDLRAEAAKPATTRPTPRE